MDEITQPAGSSVQPVAAPPIAPVPIAPPPIAPPPVAPIAEIPPAISSAQPLPEPNFLPQPPAPKSNLKLWVSVGVGVVLIVAAAYMYFGKETLYKGSAPAVPSIGGSATADQELARFKEKCVSTPEARWNDTSKTCSLSGEGGGEFRTLAELTTALEKREKKEEVTESTGGAFGGPTTPATPATPAIPANPQDLTKFKERCNSIANARWNPEHETCYLGGIYGGEDPGEFRTLAEFNQAVVEQQEIQPPILVVEPPVPDITPIPDAALLPFKQACEAIPDARFDTVNGICTVPRLGEFDNPNALAQALAAVASQPSTPETPETPETPSTPEQPQDQNAQLIQQLQTKIIELQNQIANLQSQLQSQSNSVAQQNLINQISALATQISQMQTQLNTLGGTAAAPEGAPIIVSVAAPTAGAPSGASSGAGAAPEIACSDPSFTYDPIKQVCIAPTEVTVKSDKEPSKPKSKKQKATGEAAPSAETAAAAMTETAAAAADAEATTDATAGASSSVKGAAAVYAATIQGQTGPGVLLYPIALFGANGLLYIFRRRKK